MKKIPLTQGQFALVDDEDYPLLMRHKWFADRANPNDNKYYAKTNINKNVIRMQQIILSTKRGYQIDHIDGNGLNNQKLNLRFCTKQQNIFNRGKTKGISQYKGVTWHKYSNRWLSRISFNKKMKHLGYFDDEVEAAIAYDKAAKEYFKEFARLNFP